MSSLTLAQSGRGVWPITYSKAVRGSCEQGFSQVCICYGCTMFWFYELHYRE